MSAKKTYALSVRLTCDECGRDSEVTGHYVRHRAGTVSFVLHNADRSCWWCESARRDTEAKTAGSPA